MTKNYLQHDYNSRTTPVLLKIRAKHGMAGLGIYWCLVEKIHECNGQLDYDVELLAYELGTDVEQIIKIVEQAFIVTDNMITAEWIIDNLTERESKSQKASTAGKASGKVRSANSKLNKSTTDVQQMLNKPTTDVQQMLNNLGTNVEEGKGREDKEREVKEREGKIREVKEREGKVIEYKVIEDKGSEVVGTGSIFLKNMEKVLAQNTLAKSNIWDSN